MLTFVVTHGLCHVHPRNYLFCETTPQWQCCRTAIYMDRCVLTDKQKPQKMSRIWRNVDTMKYSKELFEYQFKRLFEKLNISNWAEGLTTRYKLGYILRNRWILFWFLCNNKHIYSIFKVFSFSLLCTPIFCCGSNNDYSRYHVFFTNTFIVRQNAYLLVVLHDPPDCLIRT